MPGNAPFILAVDQGTSSTKALVLDREGKIAGQSQDSFIIDPIHPEPSWVEYDPWQILGTICDASRSAVEVAGLGMGSIAALGLDNQGETVIAFDAADGAPIYNAISWQDRRSDPIIHRWQKAGLETLVRDQTGLRLDSYFSAGNIFWIIETVPEAKRLLGIGRLRVATSDGWLLWQLAVGAKFVTDAATASRTMLLDLSTNSWSEDLLATFGIGRELLPEIVPCDSRAGNTKLEAFGAEIPVTGLCVDQHAALFGQRCFQPGEVKATYGTGCFLLVNIGDDHTVRADSLLTLLAWQLGSDQAHALEGGVYSAGAIIEWLKNRDCWRAKLGLRTFSTRLGTAPGFTLSRHSTGWPRRIGTTVCEQVGPVSPTLLTSHIWSGPPWNRLPFGSETFATRSQAMA